MNSHSISYNPNTHYKDSVTWFREFLLLQDEVPSALVEKKDDTLFLKNRIVQLKVQKPMPAGRSLFSSHLLQPSGMGPREKAVMNPGWVHGLIMACFILFAIAQYGYFKRMQQIFKAFLANRLFNQLSRDGGLFKERVSVFLFSSFLLSFSLFCFKIYSYYFVVPVTGVSTLFLYAKILTVIVLFYLLKMGLYNFSGFIFKAKKETSDYVLNIYIFGQITGVALLPFIVLITYWRSELVIYAGVAIFAALYLYRMFRSIIITASNIKISAYYLFLYLCALEILPLILLAKALMVFIG